MTKKICQNCQYFRENAWCSNSKSPYNRKYMAKNDSCGQFYQRGKKAPIWLRWENKLMQWILRKSK